MAFQSRGCGFNPLIGELRSHRPQGKKAKTLKKRRNTVTNSIKTFKMVHIQKKKNLKKEEKKHKTKHIGISEMITQL